MLETIEQLDQILIEVAELGEFAELARAADDQPMWWLAEEEGRSVIAEWNAASQRMMFSAEIGVMPEKDRETALKQALYYNLVWQQTGGARMALIPEDDSLQLMIDLHAQDLSTTQVVNVVRNLLEAARAWQVGWDETSEQGGAEPTSDSLPGNHLPPSGFVRV